MKQLKDIIYGMLVGLSNVIPGISGGTMMVVLGIYEPVLKAIDRDEYRRHLPFLSRLSFGAFAGIFLFSRIVTYLLSNYSLPVYYAFIGLVLGSVPTIYKKAGISKIRPTNLAIFLLAAGGMMALSIAYKGSLSGEAPIAAGEAAVFFGNVFYSYIWLVMASAVAAIAMILPGISGSLLLLLLGVYPVVMEALAVFDLSILLPVFFGILLGGFVGFRSVKAMLLLHPKALYVGILGLILGSLFSIWPGPPVGIPGAIGVCLLIAFAFSAHLVSAKTQ